MATDRSSGSGGSARSRPNRRQLLRALGATGATGLTALAGCTTTGDGGDGGGDGGGNGGTTMDGGKDIGTVRYGVVSPMTGPYSALAEQQRQGAKLAVKWVNDIHADRFDFTISAAYGDTEAKTSVGQQAATRVIQQDNAKFLMGAISSSVALTLNSLAKDQGVLYNPGGAAIPITGKKCNQFVFRAETNTAQNAQGSAVWTLNNLGTKVWFHIADYAYGQSVLEEWRKRMEPVGYTEVGVTRAPLGETNFDSYITEMMNSDAEVVVVGSTGGDLVNFVRQADSAGLKEQMDIMTTAGTFQSIRAGIGKAGYGVYGGTRYVHTIETGDNREFVSEFESEYGHKPDNFARVAFDSIRMTAHGIQEAGSNDPTQVKDTLAGLEVDSLFGPNRFRECDHQAVNPIWIGKNAKPDSGTTPTVKLLDKRAGSEIIPACGETNCSM